MTVSPQQFGEMVSDVKNIKEDMVEVKSDMKDMEGKVDRILSRFDQLDGGWRVLVAVGGVAGVVGGFLTGIVLKFFPLLVGALPKI